MDLATGGGRGMGESDVATWPLLSRRDSHCGGPLITPIKHTTDSDSHCSSCTPKCTVVQLYFMYGTDYICVHYTKTHNTNYL